MSTNSDNDSIMPAATNGDAAVEVRRWRDRAQVLLLLARSLDNLAEPGPASVYETVVSVMSAFLEMRQGAAFSFESEEAPLSLVALQGTNDPRPFLEPDAQKVWRRLVRKSTPSFVTPEQVARYWDSPPSGLLDGLVAVPVETRDRVCGLLVFAGRLRTDAFSEDDAELLNLVAALTGLALGHSVHDTPDDAPRAEHAPSAPKNDQARALIERQRSAIDELSTPVLQLWDGVIALPIIGVVDSRRSLAIMERLLSEIASRQSQYVILDITGVDIVDTRTADHFIKVVKAAGMLGASCILTGIRPGVAETLVDLGVEMSSVRTLRTLQDGLRYCLFEMSRLDVVASRDRAMETFDGRHDTHPDYPHLR